eukprot:scaffold86992_cov70-Cyclotella_meneghiniana.AAC.1
MEPIENLERYCSSEDLSFDGIKCALGYFVPRDRLHESNFLHRVCMNPKVTLEIVEYLVELFPDMVGVKCDMGLRAACVNEHCPNAVVKFLTDSNFDVLSCICRGCYEGLPLHYYLSRRQNVDIEIVKYMVEKYSDALSLVGDSISYTPLHVLLDNENVGTMLDIVKYLVESEPMSLRRIDSSFKQQFPVHTACKNQSITKEIIQYLVDKWPDALHVRSNEGDTPLHLFCGRCHMISNNDAIEILELILEAYPDGTLQAKHNGFYPIHSAANNKNMSVEFIEILINARPESYRLVDESGDSPFHRACLCGHIDIVKYLYRLYPDSIRAIGSDNELPLHSACWNKNPEVLKYMFGLYPEAIHLRSSSGLPIHVTLMSDNVGEHTKEIIEFLVLHDPDCVSKANNDGCLPLHLLCGYDLSYGAALLFDLYPDAILVRDDRGRLPIDVTQEENEEFDPDEDEWYNELITFMGTQQNYALTARDTAAMTTPDENGLLPLHHALHNNAPLGSIKLLVKGNPDAINLAEPGGLLPLQLACESCSLGVVKYLTGIIVECSSLRDGNDNYLLHYACRGGNVDVVRYLLETENLRAVSVKNKRNKLPMDLFNEFVQDSMNDEHDVKYVDIIWHLLLADPETIQNYCGNKQVRNV